MLLRRSQRVFSTMPKPMKSLSRLRYLVIDGYTKTGRENLTAHGASTAGSLYERLLRDTTPFNVDLDIVYPSDSFAEDSGSPLSDGVPAINWSLYDGVAWTGCSLCITSPEPRVKHQINLAKQAFQAGVPQFGSCWALQIAAVAAGGSCAPAARGREMGFGRKVMLTEAGRSHPMFEGKPPVFDAYESHEDEVIALPEESEVLAGNGWSNVQAATIRHGNGVFWGVQYHPEYDLRELAMLVSARAAKLTKMGFFAAESDVPPFVEDLMRVYAVADSAGPAKENAAAGRALVKPLLWRYGIDDDVLDHKRRTVEVSNWVTKLVIPHYLTRQHRVERRAPIIFEEAPTVAVSHTPSKGGRPAEAVRVQ